VVFLLLKDGRSRESRDLPSPTRIASRLYSVSAVLRIFAVGVSCLLAGRLLGRSEVLDVVPTLIFSVVMAALVIGFAWKMKRGSNIARWISAAVAVAAFLFLPGALAWVVALTNLLAVVAAVMSFLPASNRFFRESR
jgi:hypothetical protein